jgi:ubiquitin carboxyl-terminal hydrolase 47
MTPEFRTALYQFKETSTVEAEKAKSIPYNLQRLFLQLQFLTSKRSIETVNMTKSFGWSSSDAFQQHDVQELMRVMFDALEKKLKGTSQDGILNKLYQGKMIDYVKCKHCGHESQREDTYQDIALPIKAFGETMPFGSIEESLRNFIKPEILDGSNQYHCSQCDQKRDAEKGLKITELPYILTLQLKRFDFDYESLQRVKLSDRVEFSKIMDMTEFLPENSSNPENNTDNQPMQNNNNSTTSPSNSTENLYELFSVMIHSGSCNGGHYYGDIKSFENDRWNLFDDTRVSKIKSS